MIAARILMLLLVCAACASSAGAQPATSEPRPTGDDSAGGSFAAAFEAGDLDRARALLERDLEQRPKDPLLNYNLACIEAVSGANDRSIQRLLDAISYGFVDFHHMERDPNLDGIRDHETYRLILRGWPDLLEARASAELSAAQEALGSGYIYDRDEKLRLLLASSLPADSFERALTELRQTSEWLEEHLFPARWRGDQVLRPDPWVLIILPTPRDFRRLGGTLGLGGYYDKDLKHLISQDIGPTLRHEFFHVLHWRHMDRLGQVHPYWMMEGLASLLEDVDRDEQDRYLLAPSWRTNIAKRLERAGRLPALGRLLSMEREHFMASKSQANYAHARALAMFLFDRGVLAEWYERFIDGYADERTGTAALEGVFGSPLRDIDRQFRRWLADLPEAAEQRRPAEATLGVPLGMGSGDGPEVTGFVSRSSGRFPGPEKLRVGDVIRTIDGRATPTLDDLARVLADYQVDQIVTLEVRRGSLRLEVDVRLGSRFEPRDASR